MASDNQITIVGNLTDDPELRYTANGAAVANFRVAYSTRIRDAAGNWTDGETSFFTVNCWRALAENAAETLTRGTRVVVTGRLKQRSWENQEGEKRTVDRDRGRRPRPQPEVGHRHRARRPTAPPLRPRQRRRLGCGGRGAGGGRIETRRHHWMPGKPDGPKRPEEGQRRQVAEEGQTQVLHLLQRQGRPRRLQGRHHAAEVHLRARQDPRAARDGQLRAAPA